MTRTETAELWADYKPRKGDTVTRADGSVLGTVSHLRGEICVLEAVRRGTDGNCFIWAFREGLNQIFRWPAHPGAEPQPR